MVLEAHRQLHVAERDPATLATPAAVDQLASAAEAVADCGAVSGASGSHRAVKFRSPTRIDRSVMARSVTRRASQARERQLVGRTADDLDSRPRYGAGHARRSGIEVSLYRQTADGELEVGSERPTTTGGCAACWQPSSRSGEYVIEFKVHGPFFRHCGADVHRRRRRRAATTCRC